MGPELSPVEHRPCRQEQEFCQVRRGPRVRIQGHETGPVGKSRRVHFNITYHGHLSQMIAPHQIISVDGLVDFYETVHRLNPTLLGG